jgi:glutathione S-transferase
MTARFVLHHNPRSRAQRIKWLLEETGVPYEIVAHDFAAGTNKRPEFLRLNPDGKLPTLVDRGPDGSAEIAVTESSAITIHVADAVPEAGLAPPLGAAERGPYLTWVCYAAAGLEPAFADSVFPRAETPPAAALGWPPFEAALVRVLNAIGDGPWLLGEKFSAADVMVGSLLGWIRSWDKLPGPERFEAYLGRIAERPAHRRTFAA